MTRLKDFSLFLLYLQNFLIPILCVDILSTSTYPLASFWSVKQQKKKKKSEKEEEEEIMK